MSEPSCIYVVTDDDGACKVGVSRSPARRLLQLQTGSARRLRIARAGSEPVAMAREVETYAHWLLREAHLQGEWFAVTPEAAWVALIAAGIAVARGERPSLRIGGPGRKLRYPDKIIAPLPAGSLARMMAVLVEGEDKTDLLREAVERELKRREEAPRQKPPKPDQP